ncbi:hypothetical protein [Amycolatopsis tucumanensis]|uniref:hypothetical protein n=1 Tax=Amycolatopsis tucumanensis TaxID=401106 RepID=UPI003D730433
MRVDPGRRAAGRLRAAYRQSRRACYSSDVAAARPEEWREPINGFDRIKTERAGPDTGIEIWFSDAYGGELVFGSAKRALLGATTGCHLYAAAKERGTPRPSTTP